MAAEGGTEVVLLVEDENEVRSFTREVLELGGYQVIEASNGRDALALGRKHRGPLHLLLTDAVMPEMNGRELSQHLTRIHPEAAVLYMSGYTDRAIVHQNVVDSEIHFLQKPFTPEGLIRKVREVLDSAKAAVKA
jgi:DNA-binding NtrC family response regulator